MGQVMTAEKQQLQEKILNLRGEKSYGLIAEELGVSRNVVAGMIFRASHPRTKTLGTGYRSGPPAREHKLFGPPAGEKQRQPGPCRPIPGRNRVRGCRAALADIVALCRLHAETAQSPISEIIKIAEVAIAHADRCVANSAKKRERAA